MSNWSNLLDLPLRRSNNYGGYAWSQPLYPVIPITSQSRKDDLTFSLGRDTNHDEIERLLVESGCITKGGILDYAKQLRITGNKENGQVFVELKGPGLSDVFADKLNSCKLNDFSIRKCHTYNNKDILVRFSYIHSSINIQTEVVDNFLSHYGEVKDWFPVKHPRLRIPMGPYIFVMKDEDLQRRPLPESAFLGNAKNQVWISYDTQVKRCHRCGATDHLSRSCLKADHANPSLNEAYGSDAANKSVFAPGLQHFNVNPVMATDKNKGNTGTVLGNLNNGGTGEKDSHQSTSTSSVSSTQTQSSSSSNVGEKSNTEEKTAGDSVSEKVTAAVVEEPIADTAATVQSKKSVFKVPTMPLKKLNAKGLPLVPIEVTKRKRHQSAEEFPATNSKHSRCEGLGPKQRELSRSKGSLTKLIVPGKINLPIKVLPLPHNLLNKNKEMVTDDDDEHESVDTGSDMEFTDRLSDISFETIIDDDNVNKSKQNDNLIQIKDYWDEPPPEDLPPGKPE